MPSGRTLTDRHIAELAELYGWRHHHAPPSLTAEGYTDGFPSHVLLRAGRLVFVAIAGPTGKLVRPEDAWAQELLEVTAVEMCVVPRGELRPLSHLLRTDEPRAVSAAGEPRRRALKQRSKGPRPAPGPS